ncbi:MAG: tRNA pseudouridine(38-40) synthase TruA [Syntrophomonadaceae bacterium]|nr:tRNA pseudouridine(38-40) synthase TruA [Syntrophomonadaceae bacterium]
MKRVKLVLEYDGSNYHGFQIQKNADTVQGRLELAISRLSGEKIAMTCAGRTDAGVHALGQVVAFDSSASIPGERWTMALNAFLPEDIQVLKSHYVKANFNPRFDAQSKRYIYKILRNKNRRAFYRNLALCNSENLDIGLMQEACKYIEGQHSFRAFCASGSSAKTFERTVSNCFLAEKNNWLTMEIEANGFLYNMVRIIMGTLLEVGRGKYSPAYIEEIIRSQDRTLAGPTAPPQGLYLKEVKYNEA